MTTNKNQKARVRARMERTGESYTAARAHVLKEGEGAAIPLPTSRQRTAETRHRCEYGHYPWDQWFTRAQNAGIAEDLAHLGRSLMREADQHGWAAELWERCGWTEESADGMVRFALESPVLAKKHWDRLMETDGLRGVFVETDAGYAELTDEEFDDEYRGFALVFDRYFPATRVAAEDPDPLVEHPNMPGILVRRSALQAQAMKPPVK